MSFTTMGVENIVRMVKWVKTYLGGLISPGGPFVESLIVKPKYPGWSDEEWGVFCTEFSRIDWEAMRKFATDVGCLPGSARHASLVLERECVFLEDEHGRVSHSLFRRDPRYGWGSEPYYFSNQFEESNLSDWLLFNP